MGLSIFLLLPNLVLSIFIGFLNLMRPYFIDLAHMVFYRAKFYSVFSVKFLKCFLLLLGLYLVKLFCLFLVQGLQFLQISQVFIAFFSESETFKFLFFELFLLFVYTLDFIFFQFLLGLLKLSGLLLSSGFLNSYGAQSTLFKNFMPFHFFLLKLPQKYHLFALFLFWGCRCLLFVVVFNIDCLFLGTT